MQPWMTAVQPWMTAPKQRRRRLDDENSMGVVICLLWAAIILPSLVQSFTAPKFRQSTTDDQTFSTLAGLTNTAITLALTGLLVLLAIRALPHLPDDRYAVLVVLLLPWFWQVGRDLYAGTTLKLGGLLYPLLIFVIWALRPRIRQLAVLGYLVGLTAVLSLAMGALTPSKGILSHAGGDAVAPDKQLLPWGILIGPLTDGNPLGQFLALGAPAVLFIPRRSIRWPSLAAVVLAVVWTSNRSSLIALGVGVAIAAGLALLPRAGRRYAVITMLTLGLLLVVYLPLNVTSDAEFTNRGYIWRSSLSHWREHPVVGLGSQWYALSAKYADAIGATAFHGHNQFVQTLVLGGLVNVALLALMMVLVVRSAATWAERDLLIPAAMLGMFLVSSCFEVTLGFAHRSFLLPITLMPMAFMLFGQENPPPVDHAIPPQSIMQTHPNRSCNLSPSIMQTLPVDHAIAPDHAPDVTAEDLWNAGGWIENSRRRTSRSGSP